MGLRKGLEVFNFHLNLQVKEDETFSDTRITLKNVKLNYDEN